MGLVTDHSTRAPLTLQNVSGLKEFRNRFLTVAGKKLVQGPPAGRRPRTKT